MKRIDDASTTGRYGSWLNRGATYVPLPEDGDVLTVGLNRAVMRVDTA